MAPTVHLADTQKPVTSATTSSRCDIDEFVDSFGKIQISDLVEIHEPESGSHLTSTLDRFGLHKPFGLCNSATVYQEAIQSAFLCDMEKDLLQIGAKKKEATACWEAPIFDDYSDSDDDSEPYSVNHQNLVIMMTPQGRFVYWNNMIK